MTSLRRWITSEVKRTPGLTTPTDKVLSRGVLGIGSTTQPQPPFIIIAGLDRPPLRKLGEQQRFQIWVHGLPGSYVPIDSELKRIRNHLESLSLPLQPTGEATRITGILYEGDSVDLVDDMLETAVRYSQFLITGRD